MVSAPLPCGRAAWLGQWGPGGAEVEAGPSRRPGFRGMTPPASPTELLG